MRSGWLLLALSAVACMGAVRAESVTANLQVAVVVLPNVRLQGDLTPVAITAADIQRGYRDISRRYQLRTNAPDRIVLQLNPRLGLTDSIDIGGLQAPLHMGQTGLEVSQPLAPEFTLTYRLWLSPQAAPGEYELPVQVVASVR